MRSITPREREVLRLRFEEDLTQAEIGEIIGVSQMQVSRLIRQAVARLRLAAQKRSGAPGAVAALTSRSSRTSRSRSSAKPDRGRDRGQQPAVVVVERLDLVEDHHQQPEDLARDGDRHARPRAAPPARRATRAVARVQPRALDVAQRAADLRVGRDGQRASRPARRAACRAAPAGR